RAKRRHGGWGDRRRDRCGLEGRHARGRRLRRPGERRGGDHADQQRNKEREEDERRPAERGSCRRCPSGHPIHLTRHRRTGYARLQNPQPASASTPTVSMRWVVTCPARKASLARIFLWAGMFVVTPTIVNSSSARCIRATASWRSRPQAITLASKES